jgi:formiminotetrahydrofolate cyclodeaminase
MAGPFYESIMKRNTCGIFLLLQIIGLFLLMPGTADGQQSDTFNPPIQKPSQDSASVWLFPMNEFIYHAEKMPVTKESILGGCATITEGALAISVMIMALEVTKSHEKDSVLVQVMNCFIDSLKIRQDSLKELADGDRQLFEKFLQAGHLPATTPQEKHIKELAIYQALLEATESPINSARTMLAALSIMNRSIHYCSSVTLSDGAASASILEGSLQAVLIIADPDIAGLKEADRPQFRALRNRYCNEATFLLGKIKNYVIEKSK